MEKRARIIIGIHSSAVIVVMIDPQGALDVKRLSIQDSGLSDVLKSLKEDLQKGKKQITVILPRGDVMLRSFVLPSQDPQEVRRMVELQVPQAVPFALEECVFDCLDVESKENGTSRVLVAIVQLKKFEKIFSELDKAGLSPDAVIAATDAEADLFKQERFRKLIKNGWTVCALADRRASEVCLIHDRKMIFSQEIDCGLCDAPQDFVRALSVAVKAFRREFQFTESPQSIVLGAGLSQTDALEEALNTISHEKDARVLTEDSIFDEDLVLMVNEDDCVEDRLMWACLAQAVSNREDKQGLLPQSIIDRRNMFEQKGVLKKFLISAGIVAFAACLMVVSQTWRLSQTLQRLKQNNEALTADVAQAQHYQDAVQVLKELTSSLPVFDIMRALYESFPDEVTLSALHLTPDNLLILNGRAVDNSAVNTFQQRLVSAKVFKEIKLDYATQRRRFNKDYIDFKISCQVGQQEASND